ncbi:MAG: caspase family protein, partial [bacterium]
MHSSTRFTLLLAVTTPTVFAFSFAPNDNTAQPRKPTKWAPLVGINKYRYAGSRFPNLDGCVNDVENMKTLLTGKFGFPLANVLVLTDEKATHAGIVAAFKKHLIANAQPGDIVVFHYSGHGSQMKDLSGNELDGLDETIVPHDSRDPEGKVFDISDDEINGLVQKFSQKTKNITFIFDNCHSGTMARGANKKRTAPKDEREPPQPSLAEAAGQRGVAEGRTDLRPVAISEEGAVNRVVKQITDWA